MKRRINILFLLLVGYGYTSVAQIPTFQTLSNEVGIEEVLSITKQYGNGASIADFDNDGDLDFYLTTDQDIPDRLYQNDGSGHFIDIALQVGIEELKASRAALWFDYNGDHLLDLVVAGENCVNLSCINPVHLVLYQQLENHTFIEVSDAAGLLVGFEFNNIPIYAIGGLAAADFNGDDYLDLVLTVWGGGIKLYQNNGDGTFMDASWTSGLFYQKKTPWQPMIYDFNGDGWADIYCNIDFEENQLLLNQPGAFTSIHTFQDQAEAYGLDNDFNEMGMAMTDFDNDGDMDIYITNITRNFQGTPQYNLLFEQDNINGKVKFNNVAQSQGVSQNGWDWGTTFIDINNDGRQDLAATNGWFDFAWQADSSKMWLNTSAGFIDVSDQTGFNDALDATTLLAFDKDRDGDMDILQTLKENDNKNLPALIYENRLEDLPYTTNYITIKPRMNGPNHFAIGSEVTVIAENLISARLISAGTSFYGQEAAEAFFGLGNRDEVEEVKVKWPNNKVTFYQNIPINEVTSLQYDFIQAPDSLEASLKNEKIELTWQDSSDNETGFVILKARDSLFTNVKKILLDKNTTTYVDSNLLALTTYYYQVRAFKGNVFSEKSNRVSIQTEVKEIEEKPIYPSGVSVFPNPIGVDNFHLLINTNFEGQVRLELFNTAGQLIWIEKFIKKSISERYNFPIGVSPGVYFLKINLDNKEIWKKLIKK